jgi:surfactin family lipopeptide synthetase A
MLKVLQQYGMQPKSELLFQIEDNETFLFVFWGCILGRIMTEKLKLNF